MVYNDISQWKLSKFDDVNKLMWMLFFWGNLKVIVFTTRGVDTGKYVALM
jgi:hypothetical protein